MHASHLSKIIVSKESGGALVGRAPEFGDHESRGDGTAALFRSGAEIGRSVLQEAAVNAEPPYPTGRAFTVVVCSGCGTRPDGSSAEAVLDALRDVIRQCPLGVLVTVPCLFGAPFCSAWPAEGVATALQPCTTDREPTCCAHLVGPIRDPEDIALLSAWVQEGRWDVGLLPLRLRRNAFHRQG